MSLANGEASLDLQGTLQDIIANFNSLIADLQAQGIDPSFFKNAVVSIHASLPGIPPATFIALKTGIANWQKTVAATTIIVSDSFLTR